MELQNQLCRNCGGELINIDNEHYKCKYCGSIYTRETAEKHTNTLRKLFDDIKLEAISNARKNLYDAVNAEYISNQNVHECCFEIKKLLPDDFQANFYETAIGNNNRKLAKMIRKIDITECFDCIETMIKFLLSSLQSEFVLEMSDLIERAYKNSDLAKYEKYSTALSVEAEKLENCIYMTAFPRDVFVAYSSKDMDKVFELVECLEEQGFSCFVAARNLRHGRGAVENYDKALKEAMDSCKSFVFVSGINSRNPNCDALKKEIPYIRSVDISNAPAEFRQDYTSIPQKYKKHRVEYRIEESNRQNAADHMVSDFFDGYERVYSPEEVANRLLGYSAEVDSVSIGDMARKPVKYCISCMNECPADSKFCPSCGEKSFADTLKEADLAQKLKTIEQNTAPNKAATGAPTRRSGGAYSEGLTYELVKIGDEPIEGYAVTGIGDCKHSEVIIPERHEGKPVVAIKENAFRECESLISIIIPNSVIEIGDQAFKSCKNLKSVTLSDELTELSVSTIFEACHSLTSLHIPAKVTNIYIYNSMTYGLQSITVDKNNPEYCSVGGNLYTKDASELIRYAPGNPSTVFKVPGNVKTIYSGAFYRCENLKELHISDGVVEIARCAFMSCRNLESIYFPDSLEKLGANSFNNCPNLKSATFACPVNWKENGKLLMSAVPFKTMNDPSAAAEFLKAGSSTSAKKKYDLIQK